MSDELKDYFWAVLENRLSDVAIERFKCRVGRRPNQQEIEIELIEIIPEIIDRWVHDPTV